MRSAAALAGAAALVAGCGSDRAQGPSENGALDVAITAPSGIAAAITIVGPGGFRDVVSQTSRLTHLALGVYAIVADSVTVIDSVVGADVYAATVIGSPAAVGAGDTARVSADYVPRSATGGLWIANYSNNALVDIGALALRRTGHPNPTVTLGSIGGPSVMAFDSAGNLWVAAYDSAAINMYTADQRAAGGSSGPRVALRGGAITSPNGLAFDAQGSLWVSNQLSDVIVRFAANQLTSSGAPVAATTVSSAALSHPEGIAFDAHGNLWVANLGTNTILGYSSAQLATGGHIDPTDTIRASGGSLGRPVALAFDQASNLWVANNVGGTVVEFTATQLGASGSPTPVVTIAAPNPGAALWGLAFDRRGALWVADLASGSVYEYAPAQLLSSGTPMPDVSIGPPSGEQSGAPEGIVLDPRASGRMSPPSSARVRGARIGADPRRSSLR